MKGIIGMIESWFSSFEMRVRAAIDLALNVMLLVPG